MKGLKKVDAETGLIFTAYNFRRIINIIGIKKFIKKMRTTPAPNIFHAIKTLMATLRKINQFMFFHSARL